MSHRILVPINFCPLCGEAVPEFECQDEQEQWLFKHRNLIGIVEAEPLFDDTSLTSDKPF